MKKAIVHTVLMLALVFSLCGCSNAKDDGKIDNVTPTIIPSPTATVMPTVSPDVDNGIVTDEDGIIDDDTIKNDVKNDIAKDTDIATADAVPADSAKK